MKCNTTLNQKKKECVPSQALFHSDDDEIEGEKTKRAKYLCLYFHAFGLEFAM